MALVLGVLVLGAPAAWAQDDEATVEPAQDEPASPARRWLVPEAAERRVALDIAWGGTPGTGWQGEPGEGGWLLGGFELDHKSGFIVRSSFTSHVMDSGRPRETLVMAGAGYRWLGRFEVGATAMAAGGLPTLREERLWAGSMGVFVGLGSPEGLRLTVTHGFLWANDSGYGPYLSAFALTHDLQIPILVVDRARLFFVNRGVATFRHDPSVFANRVELHALIDGRWRPFMGVLFTYLAVGGVAGFGFRFD
jgi:hypothetical protein